MASTNVETLARMRLRSIRTTLGYSLDEIADRSNLSASTVSRIETGKRALSIDVLVPLSKTMMSAIFIIMFIYGWNQYLWPLLMTTDESFFTLMRGIKSILQVWVGSQIPDYNEAFALAVLAMVPPVAVVVIFQRMFIKGLTESDK